MQCPVCSHDLRDVPNTGLKVYVCAGGCGGIWFEHRHLPVLLARPEALPEALTGVLRNPVVLVDMTERRQCPVCANIVTHRRFFGTHRQVQIDECPKCGGIWLDHGELEAIRETYPPVTEARTKETQVRMSATLRKDRIPDTLWGLFSRKLHYNPLGVLGTTSADRGLTSLSDWVELIESPAASRSRWSSWGLGIGVAGFLVYTGLAMIIRQEVNVPVRHYYTPWRVTGLSAMGFGLKIAAAGALLHFHCLWGAVPSLYSYSCPAKIGALGVLIVGLFLYLYPMIRSCW